MKRIVDELPMLFSHPKLLGVRLGLLCALLLWLGSRLPLARGIEDWLFDGHFFQRGARATKSNIVLVALDEISLRELKKPAAFISPQITAVIKYLQKQQVAAIGVDVFVPGSLSELPEISGQGWRDGDPPGDARPFGEFFAETTNVVLPVIADSASGTIQRPLSQWWILREVSARKSSRDWGIVGLTEDDDQIVRRQELLAVAGDRKLPYFALAVFAAAQDAAFDLEKDGRTLIVANQRIPLDADRKMRINYVGPPGNAAFRRISFGDVHEDAKSQRSRSDLTGAVVLIGTMDGGQDLHSTPYANFYARSWGDRSGGLMPGLEVHANIIATMMDRAFIVTPMWLSTGLVLIVIGAVLGRLFYRLNLERGLIAAVAFHFVWKVAAFAAFWAAAWRVPILPVLTLNAVIYAAVFATRWRLMRRMLGAFKSEVVARALEADPRKVALTGERRRVTILFADIRGFTAFSESHPPETVVELLNDYFAEVVPAVDREGGTVNQFMGDGVMVLFGAPTEQPDQALRAVRAARALAARARAVAERWRERTLPGFAWPNPKYPHELRVGIGVHTGEAVVGCVGSPHRLDYSAIGDTTNTAARIEAANKEQGTEILVSAAIRDAIAPHDRAVLGIDDVPRFVQVRNKAEPLELYSVTSE